MPLQLPITPPWECLCARSQRRTAKQSLTAPIPAARRAGLQWATLASEKEERREAARVPASVRGALVQSPPPRSATARSATDAAHGPFSAVPVRGESAVPGGILVLRGCAA